MSSSPLHIAVGCCDYIDSVNAVAVHFFAFDESTGSLTPSGTAPTARNPSWVTAENGVLYSTSEVTDTPVIQSFRYSIEGGEVKVEGPVCSVAVHGAPCHIATLQQQIVVANYMGGTVSVVPIAGDDRAVLLQDGAQHYHTKGNVPKNDAFREDRQGSAHPHHILTTAGNEETVIVSDLGYDAVNEINITTGEVTKSVYLGEGTGPRRVIYRGTAEGEDTLLYSLNELDNTVSVLKGLSGEILQSRTPMLADQALSLRKHHRGGSELAVLPCGRYLVTSSRSSNELVVFRFAEDGSVVFVSRCATVCSVVRHIKFVGTQGWLLAAAHKVSQHLYPEQQLTDCVGVFKLSQEGVLAFERHAVCPFAACIAVL